MALPALNSNAARLAETVWRRTVLSRSSMGPVPFPARDDRTSPRYASKIRRRMALSRNRYTGGQPPSAPAQQRDIPYHPLRDFNHLAMLLAPMLFGQGFRAAGGTSMDSASPRSCARARSL